VVSVKNLSVKEPVDVQDEDQGEVEQITAKGALEERGVIR
jgi:hypothetical protein